MECQHRIRWTLYSSFAAIFIILSVTEVGLLTSVKNAFLPRPSRPHQKHVIVFDGGSTGSRIHVFTFLNDTDGALSLENEYFEETKPGLSSYADYPPKAAKSVETLLEKAKSLIPNEQWLTTPVVLKATAGLRLLPTHMSESILAEVLDLMRSSPFSCEETCVDVLDGEDEGLFAWYTVNFLLDYLDKPKQSVALLDLGGGSTQVTFAPVDLDSIVFSPNGYIISRQVQGKTLTIYSHSYLGLGLMSARMSILKSPTEDNENNVITDDRILQSPCMSPATNVKWKHGTEKYMVKGLPSGRYSFEECYEKAVSFLNTTVHKPPELWKKDVYGVSYYFDRAVDLGIITREGGLVTVDQLMEASKAECEKKVPKKPFLCLDGTYISALLHHGLGFPKHKEIQMVQQINGIETSWGLGAAFHLLQ